MVFKALYSAVSIFTALVIGAVAVLAVSDRSDSIAVSQSVIPTQSTHLGPTVATAAERAMTYFLVDSEAQRHALILEMKMGEWPLPISQASEYNFLVLLAGTPEDDAKALSFLDDEEVRLKAAGVAEMKVIDLRGNQSVSTVQ